jgi:hypothetical protein
MQMLVLSHRPSVRAQCAYSATHMHNVHINRFFACFQESIPMIVVQTRRQAIGHFRTWSPRL